MVFRLSAHLRLTLKEIEIIYEEEGSDHDVAGEAGPLSRSQPHVCRAMQSGPCAL